MKLFSWVAWLILASHFINSSVRSASADSASTDSGARWKALWDTHGGTATWRFNAYRSSHQLDDITNFNGATAQIKLLPKFNPSFDAKVEARVTNPDVADEGKTDSTFLEGYLVAHFSRSDLRIGKQIVSWGRADGINPTDNLTPRDYVVLLPFEEDQRFGTNALKWDYYLTNEYTVTAFTSAWFKPSKIPLVDQGLELVEIKPSHSLSDAQIALKFNKTGDDVDWSVSYFHGYSLLPAMRLITTSVLSPRIELNYNQIDVLGADVARNFGQYGFRGEVALFSTEDKQGTDTSIKNPFVYYVTGVDRTFLDNLNVNLQVFGRWIHDFTDPETITDPAQRTIAIQNAITDQQQDKTSYGLTSRISKKWIHDTLEAELLLVANRTRKDHFLRPLLTYAFTDQIKGTIGGEFYYGDADTAYGRLKQNRGMFAELRLGL